MSESKPVMGIMPLEVPMGDGGSQGWGVWSADLSPGLHPEPSNIPSKQRSQSTQVLMEMVSTDQVASCVKCHLAQFLGTFWDVWLGWRAVALSFPRAGATWPPCAAAQYPCFRVHPHHPSSASYKRERDGFYFPGFYFSFPSCCGGFGWEGFFPPFFHGLYCWNIHFLSFPC